MTAEQELIRWVGSRKKPLTEEKFREIKRKLSHCLFALKDQGTDAERYRSQGYRTGEIVDVHMRMNGNGGAGELCVEVVFKELPRGPYTGRTRTRLSVSAIDVQGRCENCVAS